jgi:Uma2 family endonuclease
VSAAIIPKLLTVEEFERLPDPPSGHYELHHGEVVLVTPPVHDHKRLERRLRKLLEDMADAHGFVADTEYAFRPLPESEVWVADVVCISSTRDNAIVKWLDGSPELTIEVKSPGNTKSELHDKAMTTLAGQGSVEFWIVDPETRTVTVFTKASGVHVYRVEQAVPVPMFAGRIFLVQLFEGIL